MPNALPDVRIEQFEGPYDLLVELAKKEKIRLSEISLSELTNSFITYIKQHEIPSEVVGSFLVVASTLLLIKARQMLPTSAAHEEEEEIANLQDRLALYEQYRTASEKLAILWNRAPLLPAHYFAEGEYQEPAHASRMPNISAGDLANALHTLIGRIPTPPQLSAHLRKRGKSLKDILVLFHERLSAAEKLVFQETVRGISRQDQAVSFLAVLEMARQQHVRLEQEEAFGTLVVHKI